jgi:EKC/KEOPS complex subunit CGI121/TPRKB
MALKLETIQIPHLPASLPVHVALYRNVQNSAFLRQQLLAGNKEFEYALIDASLVRAYVFPLNFKKHCNANQAVQVLSRAHALAAIFRAINDYMNNRLKSHNVHSEIVFSFNPTNNVK